MPTGDEGLDESSRRILDEIEALKRLQLEIRETARSGDAFDELVSEYDDRARHVFESAHQDLRDEGREAPLSAEGDEDEPGHPTEESRHQEDRSRS